MKKEAKKLMSMLSYQQRYSVASMLAVNSLDAVRRRLDGLRADMPEMPIDDLINLAERLDPYYVRRDGFVPKKVLAILRRPLQRIEGGMR